MNALELSPRRSMGQNFLISDAVLRQIVTRADLRPEHLVLEIGPGLGALTRQLIATGATVIALEKDRGFAAYLRTQFEGNAQVTVVEADALEWDFEQLPGEADTRRVVANLPYNIAIPILFRLLEKSRFRDLHLMVQRDVAERMAAAPDTAAYGALTVNLALLAEVAPVLEVPPEAFYPVPKVHSAVVRVVPRAQMPFDPGDVATFHQVVKAAFGERRKTLRNALSRIGLGREQLVAAFQEAGIDEMRRGETLSLEEFCHLSRVLSARRRVP